VICPHCGKENPDGAKFCLECGTALAEVAARGPREERKVVTVLFADLVGFTSQAERMDPEEVRAVLKPYHASVRSDLERWGGTVEKFIGDAVMALFGAPVAREDDAERAVRAALEIRDKLVADGRLHVRVGITTGEALIALEARPEAGEGMASGDVVNTAARLQVEAPVDGILVDESTYRATARVIEYGEHAPVVAKGKAEPVPVREALSARARFGVDVRQIGQAPLVGRAREIEVLTGALERAKTEREPQLVTLVGVPGIGKSRLVWELFQQVDQEQELVAWRQGRSLPYGQGISFWALGEIVKAEAGILETDPSDAAVAKVAKALGALALEPSDTEWIERHLRPLVGLEAGTELRGDHRGEAFAAWRRYLEALAEQRPLVLVFEDLHWADDGLLDFIDYLVDWATGVPLLIVGTARPELLSRRPGWGGGKPNAVTISLSALSEDEAARLVGSLVERAVIPVRVREAVLDRAQGNPLYAEEFARLVAEGGSLDDLPESVQGIIAARLDGLSREEKEHIQDAAVVGKVFWSGALARMRSRERHPVEEVLHSLERKEFVRRERRASVSGETQYAFRHILVRDVAYGQIPRGDRAERHVLAAAWIESLGRAADHAELLAQHYLSAIELARSAGRSTESYEGRARSALSDAGDRAMALNSFASAGRYFKSALDLTPAADPDRARLVFNYGKALRIAQQAGMEVLAEAEGLLRSAGDLGRAAEAAVLQAELAGYAGDGVAREAHLQDAAELADGLPVSFSKAFVVSSVSRYRMLAGHWDEAISLGNQALALADEIGNDEIRAHALNNIGTARVSAGDHGGLEDLERAVEIARAANSRELPRVINNLAGSLVSAGEMRRALGLWRENAVLAQEMGDAAIARFARSILPVMSYFDGSWDDAVRLADEFIVDVEATGGHSQESSVRGVRGRIRYARGDAQGARDDAQRAVASARRSGNPQDVSFPLSFAAWLSLRLGSPDEAAAFVEEAIAAVTLAPDEMNLELAFVLIELRRTADLERLVSVMAPARWRDVYEAIAAGRYGEAAGIAEALESSPWVAELRFAEAGRLAREGQAPQARELLKKAVAFWRSVGATQFLGDAEELAGTLEPAGRDRVRARPR
jgi:class 3 adenylate cyclase/tetratricopeptide (TPR) repeat protein